VAIGGSGPADAWLLSVISSFKQRRQPRIAGRRAKQERRVRQARVDQRHEPAAESLSADRPM
jgi:hypothetical protein